MCLPSERHPYAIHLSKALDRLIVSKDVKASWLAHCLGISEALLSDYRSGRHSIPDYRSALVDELLDTRAMAEARAEIGGYLLVKKDPKAITAADLERLFPQIVREEGHVNGDVFEAIQDGEIDTAERAHLHAHFSKLEAFFRDAKERTAPTTNEKAAPGRTA